MLLHLQIKKKEKIQEVYLFIEKHIYYKYFDNYSIIRARIIGVGMIIKNFLHVIKQIYMLYMSDFKLKYKHTYLSSKFICSISNFQSTNFSINIYSVKI